MLNLDPKLDSRLRAAIRQFWETRRKQAKKQGSVTGTKDAGARAAVTGGAQMDGFVSLIGDLLRENGVKDLEIFREKSLEIPGWYRPEKKWDLLLVTDGQLIASVEFKSQVGPSGRVARRCFSAVSATLIRCF